MPGEKKEGLLSAANGIDVQVSAGKKSFFTIFLKWAPVGIIILAAILYLKSIFYSFLSFDDEFFIINNPLVKDISWKGILHMFTNFGMGKYQPLTTFLFGLEYFFFGFNPLVFHATSVLFHLCSTWVAFKIAGRLSGQRITAVVVALLFAIHPMHVEEVAWISEQKDMLYAFLYLLSLWFYLRYLDSRLRKQYYLVAFLLFIASLMSKTEAITMPLLLVVIDVYLGRKLNWKVLLEKLPFLLCSALFIMLGNITKEASGAVATVGLEAFGFINRIFLFTSIPAFYIVRLVAPFGLSAMHYYPDTNNGILPWLYYASLPFMLLMVWLVCRRSPFRKELIFGVAFFTATICMMPQLISVGLSLFPERYTYIPYIGFFYIAGQGLSILFVSRWQKAAVSVFAGFIALFCILTWDRVSTWKDSETFYADVLEKNNDVANISYFFWLRGNTREKEAEAEAANGQPQEANERFKEAIRDYDTALSQFPRYVEAYSNRGVAYYQLGDVNSAIPDFNMALRLNPKDIRSYSNRASCKASIGDFTGALADYNEFLKVNTDDKTAYADRGMVRLNLKDTAGACEDWKKAAGLGNETAMQLLLQVCH